MIIMQWQWPETIDGSICVGNEMIFARAVFYLEPRDRRVVTLFLPLTSVIGTAPCNQGWEAELAVALLRRYRVNGGNGIKSI